jgi:peptidoglycan hydrolase-like protein with peptidoglycan-binding domain
MNKLFTAVSLGALFITQAVFVSAQTATTTSTNANCVILTADMGMGAKDASTGGQVTKLQSFLISRGYMRATTDASRGYYGPQTDRGVRTFQKDNGIIATGYVGPITRTNIQAISCAVGGVDTSSLSSVISSSSLPLLTFISPTSGALVVKAQKDIPIDWTLASGALSAFASSADTSILFDLIGSDGTSVATIGNATLTEKTQNRRVESEFQRAIKPGKANRNGDIPAGQYKIKATIRYKGTSTSTAAQAARYASESGWFTIVDPAPEPVIKVSASTTTIATSQPVTLTWDITPNSVCTVFDGSATTSIPVTSSKVITPTQTTTYRFECSLTSEWPIAGSLYKTSAKKNVTVTVGSTTSSASATINTIVLSGDSTVLTFTGTTNLSSLGFKITGPSGNVVYISDGITISGGNYTKTIGLNLFNPSGVDHLGRYVINLYGPTAVTGSANLATKEFFVTGSQTCSGTQTTGCTPPAVLPTLSRADPSTASVGTVVTLTGTKLLRTSNIEIRNASNGALVGGVVPMSSTDTQIIFRVPTSTLPLNYTLTAVTSDCAGGCSSNSIAFTVTSSSTSSSVPTLTSITPTSVVLGKSTAVTLRGEHLNSTLSVLLTGPGADTSANVTRVSSDGTTLTFTFPSTITTAGTYAVQIANIGVPTYSMINLNVLPAATSLMEPTFTASCSKGPRDTFKITLRWNRVDGATNYPVRIQGPSFATNATQYNGQSVVGFNNPGDNPTAPTGTTYTFEGLTAAGDYQFWGHAWNATAGFSTDTVKTVTCSARTASTDGPTVLGADTMCVDLAVNMHRGYEIPAVSSLQSFLVSKGILSEATGFYGDKTVAAVKMYQESKGLPETGMVYEATRAAITADSCQ